MFADPSRSRQIMSFASVHVIHVRSLSSGQANSNGPCPTAGHGTAAVLTGVLTGYCRRSSTDGVLQGRSQGRSQGTDGVPQGTDGVLGVLQGYSPRRRRLRRSARPPRRTAARRERWSRGGGGSSSPARGGRRSPRCISAERSTAPLVPHCSPLVPGSTSAVMVLGY
jgi:hypothetical protein